MSMPCFLQRKRQTRFEVRFLIDGDIFTIQYDPYIISNIFVDDPRRLVQGLE